MGIIARRSTISDAKRQHDFRIFWVDENYKTVGLIPESERYILCDTVVEARDRALEGFIMTKSRADREYQTQEVFKVKYIHICEEIVQIKKQDRYPYAEIRVVIGMTEGVFVPVEENREL